MRARTLVIAAMLVTLSFVVGIVPCSADAVVPKTCCAHSRPCPAIILPMNRLVYTPRQAEWLFFRWFHRYGDPLFAFISEFFS
jgi:hypothetical protein